MGQVYEPSKRYPKDKIIVILKMSQENWVRMLPKCIEKGPSNMSANRQIVSAHGPSLRGLHMRHC